MNCSPFSMSAFRLCLSISLWGENSPSDSQQGPVAICLPYRVLSHSHSHPISQVQRGVTEGRPVSGSPKSVCTRPPSSCPPRPHPTRLQVCTVPSKGKGLHEGPLPFSTHGLDCSPTRYTLKFKEKPLFYNQTQYGEERHRKGEIMPVIVAIV